MNFACLWHPLGLLLSEMQFLRSWMPQQPPFRINCRSLLRTFGMVTAYTTQLKKISKVKMRLYDLSGLMCASWSFLHSTRTPTSAEIQSCPLLSCIQEKSSLPTIARTTEQVASRHYTHRFWTSLLPRFWRCWRIPQRMVFFLHEFSSVLKHSFWTSWPLSTLFQFPCLRLPPTWYKYLWLCYLSRLFLRLLLLTGCFYLLFH